MPFALSLLGLVRGVKLSDILKFLSSPAGIVMMIGLAFVGGDFWGRHKANEKWQARFEQSVRDAKKVDADALIEATARHDAQEKVAAGRMAELGRQIDAYRTTIRDDCKLNPDDLSAGSLPEPAVRARQPLPPRRPLARPRPSAPPG